MIYLFFASQTCASLRTPSPATKRPTAAAQNKTTPARVSLASQEMDTTAQVLKTQHFSLNTFIYNNLTSHLPLSVSVDINECEELSTCPNAKFECNNKPGSVECLCRYKDSKDTDGCGMCWLSIDQQTITDNKLQQIQSNNVFVYVFSCQ